VQRARSISEFSGFVLHKEGDIFIVIPSRRFLDCIAPQVNRPRGFPVGFDAPKSDFILCGGHHGVPRDGK
jgi:hypothetical protein